MVRKLGRTQQLRSRTWSTRIEKVFLALHQHPVDVSEKGGTIISWKKSFAVEWVGRIETFGYDIDETKELGTTKGSIMGGFFYRVLDDDDILNSIRIYPIKY